MSEKDDISYYLMQGHGLTPLQAFRKFGCLRLSAVICQLKKEDWDIFTTMITVGKKKKRVACYRMDLK